MIGDNGKYFSMFFRITGAFAVVTILLVGIVTFFRTDSAQDPVNSRNSEVLGVESQPASYPEN